MPRLSVGWFITIIFLKVLSKHLHLQTRGCGWYFSVWQCKTCYHEVKLQSLGGRVCSWLISGWWVDDSLRNYRCLLMFQVSYRDIFWVTPKRNTGCWGKDSSSLGFVHGFYQFDGAGSLVIWKTKPGRGSKPFGVTEVDSWEHWLHGQLCFATEQSDGAGGALGQPVHHSDHPPACLPSLQCMPWRLVQAVRDGLQPWEASLGI